MACIYDFRVSGCILPEFVGKGIILADSKSWSFRQRGTESLEACVIARSSGDSNSLEARLVHLLVLDTKEAQEETAGNI